MRLNRREPKQYLLQQLEGEPPNMTQVMTMIPGPNRLGRRPAIERPRFQGRGWSVKEIRLRQAFGQTESGMP